MDDIFSDTVQEEVYYDAYERQDIYFHNPVDYEKCSIKDALLHNGVVSEPTHEWGRCRNPSCNETLNRTFSIECVCESVFYCSCICQQQDVNHILRQCTHIKDSKYTDTSCPAIMRTSVGESKITVKGTFDGVKKGDKFIRGIFSWKTNIKMLDDTYFKASYSGEFKTIKINGHIVCLPHGKGSMRLIDLTTIGNFFDGTSGGSCDFYHFTNITYKANSVNGSPVGTYEIYSEDTCLYVNESIWQVVRTLSIKGIFSGWKKTTHAMVLDISDDMKPKIVEKKEVEDMCVRRVIYEEKLHTHGFRCCVMGHIGGDEDIYVAMTVTCGCFVHGTHHYAPTCMKVGGSIIDRDLSSECTCQQKYIANLDDTHVEVINTPMVKTRNPKKSQRSPTKVKDRGVRGLSGRDMTKKKNLKNYASVDDALEDGGWELKRQTNHLVYTRVKDSKKQTFVTSKTPSCDIRRRALSTLSVF